MVKKIFLTKLPATLNHPITYFLPSGENEHFSLNGYFGQTIRLTFTGKIECVHCHRSIKKTFNEGYCYPCFLRLAACDSCIMVPHKCHFAQGTCREPEWAQTHCMIPHIVYLANTSSEVKVGLTRWNQVPTRFIDQGAVMALPILRVQSRYQAGVMEEMLKEFFTDRTKWQQMLKNEVVPIDLKEERDQVFSQMDQHFDDFVGQFGEEALEILEDEDVIELHYPVLHYPEKIKTYNFDKNPVIEDRLLGIKGQYLMFEQGVINIRKYTGYEVQFEFNI